MKIFLQKYKVWALLFLAASYAIANTIAIGRSHYELLIIPPVLYILWLFFTSLETIFFLTAFSVPLSLDYSLIGNKSTLSLPGELLMILLVVFVFLKIIKEKKMDATLFRHPVTKLILFYLLWLAISIYPSVMPSISVKSFLARIWFIIPFYILGGMIFRDPKNISRFFWAYSLTLILVIFYTLYNHAQFDFQQQKSYLVMKPFFVDHTVYGGAISFFVFFPFLFFSSSVFTGGHKLIKIFSFLAGLIILAGLYFSFSRAAWLGVAGALFFRVILALRIRFQTLLFVLFIAGIGTVLFGDDIYSNLRRKDIKEQNTTVNPINHAESISNVSTDVSNIERLNRWQAAIEMFKVHPLKGWGPGTYMFQYSPFQKGESLTEISSTRGDAGGVHSEYLVHLVELGIPGLILYLLLLVFILRSGMKIYYHAPDKKIRLLALSCIMGLITYMIHGFVNNFLDQDKVAVPFWAMVAMLVAMELNMDKTLNKESGTSEAQ